MVRHLSIVHRLGRFVLVAATCLVLPTTPPRCAEDAPAPALRAYFSGIQGRHAYGLYLADRKVGWLVEEKHLGRYRGKEAAIISTEVRIAAKRFGQELRSGFSRKTVYELDGEGAIVYYEERSDENGAESTIVATSRGDGYKVVSRSSSGRAKTWVPRSRDTLERMRALDDWLSRPPPVGDTLDTFSFRLATSGPAARQVDERETYTFLGKRSAHWGGVRTEISTVEARSPESTLEVELLPDGTMVKGRQGPLDLRMEEEDVALNFDAAVLDMWFEVAVDEDLGDPRRVDSLVVELTGLGEFELPPSDRQTVSRSESGSVILKVTRDSPSRVAVPLDAIERQSYLSSTPSIQAGHRKIRKLARSLAADREDPVEITRVLGNWVHEHLDSSFRLDASDALTALENGAGDCTEHTRLFLALARAAGVPAREVGGLVFDNEDGPAFYWHAWAEIHDGTTWVSVDPTLNQVYVGAANIRLSVGKNDMNWLGLLDRLSIDVLDFSVAATEAD